MICCLDVCVALRLLVDCDCFGFVRFGWGLVPFIALLDGLIDLHVLVFVIWFVDSGFSCCLDLLFCGLCVCLCLRFCGSGFHCLFAMYV